jgi:GcrA cell cycle regulator
LASTAGNTQAIVVLTPVVHKFLWFRAIGVLTGPPRPIPYLVGTFWGNHDMEWAEETIFRLRALWDEGHSTAEIGRRLGVSKNAVVGKAHRLDLPARPSPIRRDGPGEGRPPRRTALRRVAGPTLPPLSSTDPNGASAQAMMPSARPLAPRPTQVPPPVRVLPPPPRPYGRVITCCWPIGEPGTRSFCFCDAASVPGKPYCDDHAQLAYVRVRDRREDAA